MLQALFLLSTLVKAQPEKAEAGIKAIMQEIPVMGMSVAVVKDNKIIYSQVFWHQKQRKQYATDQ